MQWLCYFLLIFEFVFLLRMVMSFFPISTGSPVAGVRDLAVAATDPVIIPIRRSVPPLPGAMRGFGLAEILVLIGIQILVEIICSL